MSKLHSKGRAALLLSAVTIIVLSTLVFINERNSGISSLMSEGANSLSVTGEVSAISNNNSIIFCTNNFLLEAQSDILRVKNTKGEVVWSQKYTGNIIKMANAGSNIVIIDSSNSIYYYTEQGKLLWNYKCPLEITEVFTEENGSILIEYRGLTGGRAEVFEQNGSKIGNISVENAEILSFSAGVSSFSISVLDLSGETVKTKIITYNFKGDILWANNYDEKLITKLNYTKNNKLLAVEEDRILSYKNDGNLDGELEIEGSVKKVSMSDYLTVIVTSKQGKHYVECYDSNNKKKCRIELSAVPLGVFPLKNNFIVYYKDELMILTSKGNATAVYKSNTDILRAYMTMDNKVYIVSNRKLQLLEYKKK